MQLKNSELSIQYVKNVNSYIKRLGGNQLSKIQEKFISFCVYWMVMLGELNFAGFALGSLGDYTAKALSWMLHHSKIDWSSLLKAAILNLLVMHEVSSLNIIIDDTDRPRSKTVKVIWGVFKTLDKATKGWIKAQNLVFVCLVTNKITIPFMCKFYRPDPKMSKWKKEDEKLRKQKISKDLRPLAPKNNKKYPSRIEIAKSLLMKLKKFLIEIKPILGKSIKIHSISFDSAYLSPKLVRDTKKIFPAVQVISQLRKTQIVWDKSGKALSVTKYFEAKQAIEKTIRLRYLEKKIYYVAARLTVKSHGCKLYIIALKYKGEAEYRYLAATELTWRSMDIIKAYAFRWLIEVVNFDWKQFDGWGRKAFQQGADGACRGVILSLLADCFLLSHPIQLRQSRAGLRLWTAGSVVRYIQHESILETIETIFNSPNPQDALKSLAKNLANSVQLIPSTKHMIGVDMKDFEPTPSLLQKFG